MAAEGATKTADEQVVVVVSDGSEMGSDSGGLQDYRTTGLRDYGTTGLQDYGTTGLRDYGLRDYGTTGPWDYGTMGLRDYGTLPRPRSGQT